MIGKTYAIDELLEVEFSVATFKETRLARTARKKKFILNFASNSNEFKMLLFQIAKTE